MIKSCILIKQKKIKWMKKFIFSIQYFFSVCLTEFKDKKLKKSNIINKWNLKYKNSIIKWDLNDGGKAKIKII